MLTGTSLHNTKEALRLTRIYPDCLYCTAGVHPHEAKSWTDTSLNELKSLALNSECVAVGECGLDYNRDFSPPHVQREVFEQQVHQLNFYSSLNKIKISHYFIENFFDFR